MEEKTILLVEDDVALLEGMGDTLEMMGYQTIKATNGREGLERLAQVRPDLIISDIMMPEMDGYEFHKAVSSMSDTATIPFIFLTAKSDQADVRKGLREGVDAYLTKPFDLEDLLLHVQNKLDRFATIRNQTMAQLDELQRQIVTMFSHELRTPLTYIQGYTDLMADSSVATSPEEMTMFLQGIQAGSRRLNRLVESLLILVQLDTNVYAHEFERFAMVETNPGRFVRLAVTSLEPAATERSLAVKVELQESLPAVRIVS
jgi:CheY-like chemotaxis protein